MGKNAKTPFYGIWANLREEYMQSEQLGLYNEMVQAGELLPYLKNQQKQYSEKFSDLVERMMVMENVNDELQAQNQMEWVGRVNNIRARVREMLTEEICR